MVDRTYLRSQAAVTGFAPDTLEKVLRLLELLGDIDRHPLLSKVLALKGGTALNLFFGAPERLSVDIDLNYIGATDREGMLAQRPDVERAVQTMAQARQYTVQYSAEAHAGRTAFLSYRNALGTNDQIQIDLNFLHRLPILEVTRKKAWAPAGTPSPKVTIVSLEELFAGKFRAFMDRVLPRDAFDIARIAETSASTWEAPRTRAIVVALAGTLNHPFYKPVPRLQAGLTEQEVAQHLHPMLVAGERPEASALMERAAAAVKAAVQYPTEPEREYTERLQRGELCPEILLPGEPALAARLARHPALLWKAHNSRRHRGGGGE